MNVTDKFRRDESFREHVQFIGYGNLFIIIF